MNSDSHLLSEREKDAGRECLDHQDDKSLKKEEKEISRFRKGVSGWKGKAMGSPGAMAQHTCWLGIRFFIRGGDYPNSLTSSFIRICYWTLCPDW